MSIKNDIKIVEELKGTYSSDSEEFYDALDNILEFVKNKTKEQGGQIDDIVMQQIIGITGETSGNVLLGYISEAYKVLNINSESLIKITVELVSDKEFEAL